MQLKLKKSSSGQMLLLSSSIIHTEFTENKIFPSVGSLIMVMSLIRRNNFETCLIFIKQKLSVVFCYYDISN